MITLRDYTQADAARLVVLANNKNVSRYLIHTFPYPYTMQDAVEWIESGSQANNSITKVIEYQGNFVGSIAIIPQTGWKSHTAEIGYWVGEEYWGKGIAINALRAMSDAVFSGMKLTKLYAPVLGQKHASMRVLEKCGYVLEGIFKQEVFKDEQYFDGYYYAKHYP